VQRLNYNVTVNINYNVTVNINYNVTVNIPFSEDDKQAVHLWRMG